ASDWLRERIVGKVNIREGLTITDLTPSGGGVTVTFSDRERLAADHVIFATGYKINLEKLQMGHPPPRSQISTDRAIPILDAHFQSSVPGLYFVGLTSLHAFGPLFRFVGGCHATARRIAPAIARTI